MSPQPRGNQSVNRAVLRVQDPDLEGPLAFLGGPYSNHLALRAASEDARRRGAKLLFCLGDLGGFRPEPGKIFPILHQFPIITIARNYDEALATRPPDCGRGSAPPPDQF